MKQNTPPLSDTQLRLQHWSAFVFRAIAFGGQMTLTEKFDPRRAVQQAEMLDVWLRLAMFTLLGELGALHASSKDKSEHAEEIANLLPIAGAFAGLILLAAKVKRDCLARMSSVPCYDTRMPNMLSQSLNSRALLGSDFVYYDTS